MIQSSDEIINNLKSLIRDARTQISTVSASSDDPEDKNQQFKDRLNQLHRQMQGFMISTDEISGSAYTSETKSALLFNILKEVTQTIDSFTSENEEPFHGQMHDQDHLVGADEIDSDESENDSDEESESGYELEDDLSDVASEDGHDLVEDLGEIMQYGLGYLVMSVYGTLMRDGKTPAKVLEDVNEKFFEQAAQNDIIQTAYLRHAVLQVFDKLMDNVINKEQVDREHLDVSAKIILNHIKLLIEAITAYSDGDQQDSDKVMILLAMIPDHLNTLLALEQSWVAVRDGSVTIGGQNQSVDITQFVTALIKSNNPQQTSLAADIAIMLADEKTQLKSKEKLLQSHPEYIMFVSRQDKAQLNKDLMKQIIDSDDANTMTFLDRIEKHNDLDLKKWLICDQNNATMLSKSEKSELLSYNTARRLGQEAESRLRLELPDWQRLAVKNILRYLNSGHANMSELISHLGDAAIATLETNRDESYSNRYDQFTALFPKLDATQVIDLLIRDIFEEDDKTDKELMGGLYLCACAGWSWINGEIIDTQEDYLTIIEDWEQIRGQNGERKTSMITAFKHAMSTKKLFEVRQAITKREQILAETIDDLSSPKQPIASLLLNQRNPANTHNQKSSVSCTTSSQDDSNKNATEPILPISLEILSYFTPKDRANISLFAKEQADQGSTAHSVTISSPSL